MLVGGESLVPHTPAATTLIQTRGRPGRLSTKKSNLDSEYKKNKQKTMEGILKVQEERRRDFCTFMNNQARASAFKMMKDIPILDRQQYISIA